MNSVFRRLLRYNLRLASTVYRLIDKALIDIFRLFLIFNIEILAKRPIFRTLGTKVLEETNPVKMAKIWPLYIYIYIYIYI